MAILSVRYSGQKFQSKATLSLAIVKGMPLFHLLLTLLAWPLPAQAMNPLHLKECEAQLLGGVEDDPFAIDYRNVRLEAGSDLEVAFQRLFYTTLHQADVCAVNVAELLRFAQSQGIDTSEARVLVMTGPTGEVHAKAARGFRERHWLFHVAIAYRGRVLDLDFTNRPTILGLAEYRERMFGADSDVIFTLRP